MTTSSTSAQFFAEAVGTGRLAPRSVIEFINKITLSKPNLDILRPNLIGKYPPIAHLIIDSFKSSERRQELLLPNLMDYTNCIGIFSDYGGDNGHYRSFSFLLTDYHVVTGPFADRIIVMRRKYGLFEKEISFKDMRFGPIKRCMEEFTDEADRLPGLIFTLLIHRDVKSLFGDGSEESKANIKQAMALMSVQQLKPKIFERLLTIVHCASILTALLSRDGHKLFWMTDHDAISVQHAKMLNVFVSVLNLYTNNRRFDLVGGAVPFEKKSLPMMDALSVTDLAAGVYSHLLTQFDTVGIENSRIKDGAEHLLMWLARHGIGLKKMTVAIRQNAEGFVSGVVHLEPRALPENALVAPIYFPASIRS